MDLLEKIGLSRNTHISLKNSGEKFNDPVESLRQPFCHRGVNTLYVLVPIIYDLFLQDFKKFWIHINLAILNALLLYLTAD